MLLCWLFGHKRNVTHERLNFTPMYFGITFETVIVDFKVHICERCKSLFVEFGPFTTSDKATGMQVSE